MALGRVSWHGDVLPSLDVPGPCMSGSWGGFLGSSRTPFQPLSPLLGLRMPTVSAWLVFPAASPHPGATHSRLLRTKDAPVTREVMRGHRSSVSGRGAPDQVLEPKTRLVLWSPRKRHGFRAASGRGADTPCFSLSITVSRENRRVNGIKMVTAPLHQVQRRQHPRASACPPGGSC